MSKYAPLTRFLVDEIFNRYGEQGSSSGQEDDPAQRLSMSARESWTALKRLQRTVYLRAGWYTGKPLPNGSTLGHSTPVPMDLEDNNSDDRHNTEKQVNRPGHHFSVTEKRKNDMPQDGFRVRRQYETRFNSEGVAGPEARVMSDYALTASGTCSPTPSESPFSVTSTADKANDGVFRDARKIAPLPRDAGHLSVSGNPSQLPSGGGQAHTTELSRQALAGNPNEIDGFELEGWSALLDVNLDSEMEEDF